ncbi:MAG TPA: hypothetical protein VJK54_07670, partial [Chthoniobacterales bacterium]|nr:hypothetical protein [Chthoniobacterales bacterium]
LQEARLKIQTTTGISLSCWKEVITSLERSAEYWKKLSEDDLLYPTELGTSITLSEVDFLEEEEFGTFNLFGYIAAEQSEQAAECSRQAAEAFGKARGEDKNWREGNQWREAGKSAQYSADCHIKGMESQYQEIMGGYEEAAEIFKKATELFIQAVQLLKEGKEKENMYFWIEGNHFQSEGISRKYKLQELEAQEAGKATLAAGYREAAATIQRASEQYQLAAQAYVAGKDSEGATWSQVGKSLQVSADYQAKASEAQDVGKTTFAAGYLEAAATSQRASEQYELAAKVYAAGKQDESSSWQWEGYYLKAKAEHQAKAAEAQEAGKIALATGYREAAETYQRAIEYQKANYQNKQVAKTSALSEMKRDIDQRLDLENSYWSQPASLSGDSACYQVKACETQEVASEAQKTGKINIAEDYRKAAVAYQSAADQYKLAAQASVARKKSECNSLSNAGAAFYNAAEKLEKAIEAEAAGKPEVAKKWREVMEQQLQATDLFTKASEAKTAGKEQKGYRQGYGFYNAGEPEGDCWHNAGLSLNNAAEKLAKAIEAEIAGKPEIARKWHEAAEQNKRSVESYAQAVKTYAAEKEKYSFRGEGHMSNDIFKQNEEVGFSKEEESGTFNSFGYSRPNYGKHSVNPSMEYAPTHHQGNPSNLNQRINQPSTSHLSPPTTMKSVGRMGTNYGSRNFREEDYSRRNFSGEGYSWRNAGLGFHNAAEKLAKAIEAELADNPKIYPTRLERSTYPFKAPSSSLGIAQKWRDAAAQHVSSVEYYTKAAEAHREGKDEGTSWDNAGRGFDQAAQKLEKAIEAEISGKSAIARKWREAAKKNILSVEPYTQAAGANTVGQKDGRYSFNPSVEYTVESNYNQSNRSNFNQYIDQPTASIRSVGRIVTKDERDRWHDAGNGFHNAAEKLEKAIEAEIAGKSAIAQKWREVAEQQVRSVEPYTQAAKAYTARKKEEGFTWNYAGKGLYFAAEHLQKAIEADEDNKPEVALKYREAARKEISSLDFFSKAVTAYAAGKTEEGLAWRNAGTALINAGQSLQKTINADKNNKLAIAQEHREIAGKQILIAELFTKTATACAAGKTEEGNSWRCAGNGLYRATQELEQAINADQNNKPEIALKYREAARKYILSSESYTKAASGYERGDRWEHSRRNQIGLDLHNEAKQLEATIEG